jgi:hypothetical protein
MQHFVGRYRIQYALQTRRVWAMQEELLPEAIGQLRVFLIFLHHVNELLAVQSRQVRTLNNVSYRRMILGWKISGRESWVRGDGSMLL